METKKKPNKVFGETLKVFSGELPKLNINAETEHQLQRTEEWFEQRRGRFTGSRIKDLMGCNRSTSKMEWGRAEKLIDFNEKSIKYIYEKAKERQRGKVIQTPVSVAMKYGTENEDIVFKILQKDFPNHVFENVSFIAINEYLGASPDGKVTIKRNEKKKKIGLEIKCSTGWNGVFERIEIACDQSHKDFWQLQTEMMALETDEIMYVVAEPSESIFEPNITDISFVYVHASPVHQKAIKQRAEIGNKAIELFLKGMNINQAVQKAASEFEIKD